MHLTTVHTYCSHLVSWMNHSSRQRSRVVAGAVSESRGCCMPLVFGSMYCFCCPKQLKLICVPDLAQTTVWVTYECEYERPQSETDLWGREANKQNWEFQSLKWLNELVVYASLRHTRILYEASQSNISWSQVRSLERTLPLCSARGAYRSQRIPLDSSSAGRVCQSDITLLYLHLFLGSNISQVS